MAIFAVSLFHHPYYEKNEVINRATSYLLSFLDRTNIGNARLAGMEEDLGMVGTDYNNTLTIFFVSYALVEPITNALLKRLTPRIFFTGIIIVW